MSCVGEGGGEMKGAYYNENDPFAAAWLRELIKANLIAPGDVDERSIVDVRPEDIRGYTQHHFFAGIGGWSYALRLARWGDKQPIWTGSCPCQPFSAAGKQAGFIDPRHLWPEFFRLIRECRPDTIFGEQVDKALAWFDLVSGDMEGEGYAVGAAIIGAHSVGAPHRRQRLYFVAEPTQQLFDRRGDAGERWRGEFADSDELGDPSDSRLPERIRDGGVQREALGTQTREAALGGSNSFWSPCSWLPCRDGKSRPVEPGTFPLVARLPSSMVPGGDPSESYAQASHEARVGRLRGYGNSIVPQVAAEFVRAYAESL